jgi:hypothetical protein
MFTLLTVEMNTPSSSHPAGGEKGPMSTHTSTVDSGKDPHSHIAGGGKVYTLISKCRNTGKR